jgi:ATP-dependent HslUV protease ATP-binding subunit HslU
MIDNLTPNRIVEELDNFIVGQEDAKKAVALSLRNRWRRKKLDKLLQEEVMPKNILMVGPTGVGKTEIARRLSKLANAPFIKVEATKFTEIGYVGRDVESMIRDLMEVAVKMERDFHRENLKDKAQLHALNKVLDVLVGPNATPETREKFKEKLLSGSLNKQEIEIEVVEPQQPASPLDIPGSSGASMGVINLSDMLGKALSNNKKKLRKLQVEVALHYLMQEEYANLLDEDMIIKNSINMVENEGIVFIDEIDKIVVKSNMSGGKEVSREGVQRDLLPILEGSTVATKYGTIKTDHILFICSGAFHLSKPADLLPELQGRLPIRVELHPLNENDMLRILKEPVASLPLQYRALLDTEEVTLDFTEDGLAKIAALSSEINRKVENIGARRLHTVLEKILEDVSYRANELNGQMIKIDAKFVEDNMKDTNLDNLDDLSKFIL